MLGLALRNLLPDALAPTRYELDCMDVIAVSSYLVRHEPDLIVHCAAQVGGIGQNIADPCGFLYNNMILNMSVIKAAARTGIKYLLNIGSSCMYPRGYKSPLKESYLMTAPLEPTNEGYALAKIASAKFCEYCNRQYAVAYKTLIPSNLYGPNDKSNHLIPSILNKLHGEGPIEIWGDGTARREFLYVNDLAKFIVAVSSRVDTLPQYMNVGYGVDYSINQFYEIGAEVVGYKGKFSHNLEKPTGMQSKLLCSELAESYGWKPETGIKEGMKLAYEGGRYAGYAR